MSFPKTDDFRHTGITLQVVDQVASNIRRTTRGRNHKVIFLPGVAGSVLFGMLAVLMRT